MKANYGETILNAYQSLSGNNVTIIIIKFKTLPVDLV